MPTVSLTNSFADRVKPAEKKVVYRDKSAPLLLIVTPKGARTWYTPLGKQHRQRIGRYPDYDRAAAEEEAFTLRRAWQRGEQLQTRQESGLTVRRLATRYEAEVMPRRRPSTQMQYRGILKNYIVPALGKKRVIDVKRGDLVKLHRKVTASGKPIRANRIIAVASVLFAYAIGEEVRADNPAEGVERNQEAGREVFLTAAQLREVLLALDDIEAKAVTAAPDVLRFLIATGARSGEARNARWEQFDHQAGGAVLWTKAAAATKQNKKHRIYLTRPAVEILAKRREFRNDADGGFVFPGAVKGQPVKQIHSTWTLVRRVLPFLAEVRPHDLRHSFASLAIAGGLSLPVIGGLLGHSTTKMTERYAHLADDLMREASARVGAQLLGADE